MPSDQLILLIDSSRDSSFVALSENGQVVIEMRSEGDRKFSLHESVRKMFRETAGEIRDLHAVAVTEGPGSYTGLRVGMATAKGICFALNKPLITISTLHMMAGAMIHDPERPEADLFCPALDARRDEVFLAVYDKELNMLMNPQPMIAGTGWPEYVLSKKMLLSGSGGQKLLSPGEPLLYYPLPEKGLPSAMAKIAAEMLNKDLTTSIIWSEPAYLKEFYFK